MTSSIAPHELFSLAPYNIVHMEFSVKGVPVTVTRATAIMILVGLAIFTYGGYDYVQQSTAVDDAVPIEATIVDSSTSQSEGRGIAYNVHVSFTYTCQGTEYTSNQLFPGNLSPQYETRSKAQSVIATYDSGTTVTAYVDPAAPNEAFLERRTTQSPLIVLAFAGVILLWTALDAVGVQTPGQDTELRPEGKYEPTRHQTLFGIERETVHRLSKRLIIAALVTIPVSLVTVVLLVLGSVGATGSTTPSIEVDLTDPIGLLLGAAFVATLVLIASTLLYGIWSFTEYRRLRERIPEPRPPSPFKHPTRLITILATNDGLDDYGKQVKRTGFAFVMALFFSGALLEVLVF